MEKRILVIDDEPLVRLVTKEMLKELDYDVLVASNGNEGIELYKNEMDSIDLVICDMMMPELNGVDVLNVLKTINENVKFVILSGYSQQDPNLVTNEIDAYLSKPILLDSLKKVLNKLL